MRLVIRLMGLDVLDLELTTADAEDEDPAAALNGGSTGGTIVGFEAPVRMAEDAGLPDREYG